MKIAFINIYQGSVNRGAEVFVNQLSSRLSRGNEVALLSGNTTPLARWPILWRLYLDPHGLGILFFTLKLIPKILRKKYDIIVALNGGFQSIILRKVCWLTGSKLVISGQSGKGWDDRVNLWSFPNCFVSTSSDNKAWAKAFNPFVKVEYIPNGVDLQKFKPTGAKYKHGLKPPVVLCVAALVRTKQIEVIIQAVSKFPEVSLLVVGSGDQKLELQTRGEKLLGNRFQLISAKPDQMPDIYRSADIFAFTPYTREAFGIVYVEALACNLPVVGTNDKIRQEIIGGAGVLVDNPKPDNVSVAIKKALSKRWGNEPRQQAMKFSWDNIAKQYEQLFLDLIKE